MTEYNGTKRQVYFINQLKRADDGQHIPCIAVEGESGFYATDWKWGNDLEKAQQLCDERNKRAGISRREAYIIQVKTMQLSLAKQRA